MDENVPLQNEQQSQPQKEHTGFTALIFDYPDISQEIINRYKEELGSINTRIGRLPESAKHRKRAILDKELTKVDKDLNIEFNAKMFESFNKSQSQMVIEASTTFEAHAQLEKYQSSKGLRGMDKAMFGILEAYRNGEIDGNFPVFDYLLNATNRLGIVGKTLRNIRGYNAKTMREQFEVYMITLYYTDKYAHAIKRLIDSLDNPAQQQNTTTKQVSSLPTKIQLHHPLQIKLLTNLLQSLRELNRLEATDGKIMGFILSKFLNKHDKPFEVVDLQNYFEKDTQPEYQKMRWNGELEEFIDIWRQMNTPTDFEDAFFSIEVDALAKILSERFVWTQKDLPLSKVQLMRLYDEPYIGAYKHDVRVLMKG